VKERLRAAYDLIVELVPEHACVVDLGCGTGDLLARLRREKHVHGRGIDVDPEKIASCVERGIPVVQADLDAGLADVPDKAYDVAILSLTLQVVRRPDVVLREMLRVSRRSIVTFPNFAFWRVRWGFLFSGRMPVTRALPYQWYSTPNIHQLTIADFRSLVAANDWLIVEEIPIIRGVPRRGAYCSNLLAEWGVFVLEKNGGAPGAEPTPR
jgi:methionine biosynthesis protein MetW